MEVGVAEWSSWDIKAKVIKFFQPDILCMTETWLRGG